MSGEQRITEILLALQEGKKQDAAELAPLVYDELRALAARAVGRLRKDPELQPTALVNEAYVTLARVENIDWRGRTHFRAVASRCIRRILIDHARKHREGPLRVTVEDVSDRQRDVIDILALNEALTVLSRISTTAANVVELRFFGGLTEPEIALALCLSERTIRREWTTARAWLRRYFAEDTQKGL